MKNPGVLLSYFIAGLFPVLLWFWPVPLEKLSVNTPLSDFLLYVPVLALAGAGVMGWKLNQTRILLGAFVCIALYGLLFNAGSFFPPSAIPAIQDALVIGLPLAFAMAVAGRESPLLDRRSVRRLLLVSLPLIVLGVAGFWWRPSLQALSNWAPGGWRQPLDIPWVGLGTVALYWLGAGLSRDRRIRGFVVALGLALVPILFAVRALSFPAEKTAGVVPGMHIISAFLAVSLILFHAVFSMYWHRVYMDDLTGVPNRRALEEELQNVGGDYTLAMIDIDLFKEYNDRFGHDEGDNILRVVAGHMERELACRVYRYGGEEFCALWQGRTMDQVFQAMENARVSLERRVFYARPSRQEPAVDMPKGVLGVAVGVTVSAGLSAPGPVAAAPEEVLRKADEAMYEAKRTGRNRTVIAPQ